jgi:hypothetical protein
MSASHNSLNPAPLLNYEHLNADHRLGSLKGAGRFTRLKRKLVSRWKLGTFPGAILSVCIAGLIGIAGYLTLTTLLHWTAELASDAAAILFIATALQLTKREQKRA